MKKLKVTIIALMLLITGCEKLEDEMLYIIKQGEHYANKRPVVHIKHNRIDFNIYIHPSWVHEAQYDVGWSKLTGLSQGINVHQNSGRLAWRCVNGQIIMAAYFYCNGKCSWIEFPGTYEVGKNYAGYVHFGNNACHIGAGNASVSLPGYKNNNGSWLCHPYFGGRLPAPHIMYFYFHFI